MFITPVFISSPAHLPIASRGFMWFIWCHFLWWGFDVALNSEGRSERQIDQPEWELICILQRRHSNWQPSLLFLLMFCIIHSLLHIFFSPSPFTFLPAHTRFRAILFTNCFIPIAPTATPPLLSLLRAFCLLLLTTHLDNIKTCGKIYSVAWHHFYFLSVLISPRASGSPFFPIYSTSLCCQTTILLLFLVCILTESLWGKKIVAWWDCYSFAQFILNYWS